MPSKKDTKTNSMYGFSMHYQNKKKKIHVYTLEQIKIKRMCRNNFYIIYNTINKVIPKTTPKNKQILTIRTWIFLEN